MIRLLGFAFPLLVTTFAALPIASGDPTGTVQETVEGLGKGPFLIYVDQIPGAKYPAQDPMPVMGILPGERYDAPVPLIKKRNTVCLSCGMGRGLSVAHDHNMGGMTSSDKYPRGPLTVFAVE